MLLVVSWTLAVPAFVVICLLVLYYRYHLIDATLVDECLNIAWICSALGGATSLASFVLGRSFATIPFLLHLMVLPGFPWAISLNQMLKASTRALQIRGFQDEQAVGQADLRW